MSSLSAIQNQLAEFHPESIPSAEFKSVLSLYVNADRQRSAEDCIAGLQDVFSVEMLFQKELLQRPTTLYCILRDYFVLKEFIYKTAPGSNKITRRLANSLFM